MRGGKYNEFGGTYVCGLCGREFFVPQYTAWIYKRRYQYRGADRHEIYCSYKCRCVAEKAWETERAARKAEVMALNRAKIGKKKNGTQGTET